MFSLGDIVQIFGTTAGHKKYHLCVCEIDEHGVSKFLFLNSHEGWEGDFVLSDKEIPCLPESKTGKSVVCCNVIVKYNAKQLKVLMAKKLGSIDKKIVVRLLVHLPTCRTLPRTERQLIINNLTKLI